MSVDNSKVHIYIAIGAAVGALCALVILGAVAAFLRVRRRKANLAARFDRRVNRIQGRRRRSTILEHARAAAFGSPYAQLPGYGYVHKPGTNMRVAYLGDDGAWHFTGPGNPAALKYGGVPELDKIPRSADVEEHDPEQRPRPYTGGYLTPNYLRDSVTPPAPTYITKDGYFTREI